MFSLIITIISIALVAALALATLYYGGSAFNRGSAGATAAQLINEGQQLNGAVAIAKADAAAGAGGATTFEGLVSGKYMTQLPASFASSTGALTATVTKADIGIDVCQEVEKRAGRTAPATVADANAAAVGVYSCVKSATSGKVDFVYSL